MNNQIVTAARTDGAWNESSTLSGGALALAAVNTGSAFSYQFDRNHNGVIDDATELFGEKFARSGTAPAGQTGFGALATLAAAGATAFTAATSLADPATGLKYFDELQVWVNPEQDTAAAW